MRLKSWSESRGIRRVSVSPFHRFDGTGFLSVFCCFGLVWGLFCCLFRCFSLTCSINFSSRFLVTIAGPKDCPYRHDLRSTGGKKVRDFIFRIFSAEIRQDELPKLVCYFLRLRLA